MENKGFTLIELMLVMGISMILFAVAASSLFVTRNRNSILSFTEVLASDIRQQQLNTMLGYTRNPPNIYNYGIHFGSDKYTLFRGISYNANDPSNINITLDSNIRFTNNTILNSIVVFDHGNGNYLNFINGQNSITVVDNSTGQSKIIIFNKLGGFSY